MRASNPKRGGARKGAGRKPGATNKATAKAREMAEATGVTPLEFMLQVMRDENALRSERLDMAKAAAPYIHARLSSVEATGPGGGPILTKATIDPSSLNADQLRALASIAVRPG